MHKLHPKQEQCTQVQVLPRLPVRRVRCYEPEAPSLPETQILNITVMIESYKNHIEKKMEVDNRVKAIMNWLNERPKDGDTAVRQSKTLLQSVFEEFMKYCDDLFDARGVLREVAEGRRHFTHAQRLMSDYKGDYKEVDDAFFRFECTDFSTGIEYPQPFYVRRPAEFHGRIV